MKKLAVFVLVFVSSAVAACSGGGSHPDAAVPSDASMSLDAASLYVPSGYTLSTSLSTTPQRTFSMAGAGAEAGKHYEVVLVTDKGRLVLDLAEAQAPLAVNSMVWLARNHFYDGTAFHRVITGFVAQGGDPLTVDSDTSAWGTGGPGYSFANEITGRTFDALGVLGMAHSNVPNSNGSQFFITYAAQHSLDGMYTVFGNLVEGMDVLLSLPVGEPPDVPARILAGYAVEKPI